MLVLLAEITTQTDGITTQPEELQPNLKEYQYRKGTFGKLAFLQIGNFSRLKIARINFED